MSEQSDFRKEKQLEDFTRACNEQRTNLYRNSFRLCGNAEDAEDCVQKTLINAYQKFDRFQERSSLKTWLYAINGNVCLTHRRERTRKAAVPFDDQWAPSLIQEDEHRIQIDILLAHAPADVRQALLLMHEGATSVEAAALLGIKESTLRKHIETFQARLRAVEEAENTRL